MFCLLTYPLVVVEVVVVLVVVVVVVALASPGAASLVVGAIVVVVVSVSGHTVVRASTHLQHSVLSSLLGILSYSSLVVTVPSSLVTSTWLQFW